MRVLETSPFLSDLYQQVESTEPGQPIKVDLVRGTVNAPAGSYYIPLNQPLAYLVVAALEPDSSDSFVTQKLISGLPHVARVISEPAFKLQALP